LNHKFGDPFVLRNQEKFGTIELGSVSKEKCKERKFVFLVNDMT